MDGVRRISWKVVWVAKSSYTIVKQASNDKSVAHAAGEL